MHEKSAAGQGIQDFLAAKRKQKGAGSVKKRTELTTTPVHSHILQARKTCQRMPMPALIVPCGNFFRLQAQLLLPEWPAYARELRKGSTASAWCASPAANLSVCKASSRMFNM